MKIREWLRRMMGANYNPDHHYKYYKGGKCDMSLSGLTDLELKAEQAEEIVLPDQSPQSKK